jgi:hypothetical protein
VSLLPISATESEIVPTTVLATDWNLSIDQREEGGGSGPVREDRVADMNARHQRQDQFVERT